MKSRLEKICFRLDSILSRHDVQAKVVGGYVAGSGLLFSLSDNIFLNTNVRSDIQHSLQASKVIATVGVVMVHNYHPNITETRSQEVTVIQGDFTIEEFNKPDTVNVLDLIATHEQNVEPKKKNGRPLITPFKPIINYSNP